ncbi:MAG: alpha/beta hydrolase [Betaproteobacteria bacterium]
MYQVKRPSRSSFVPLRGLKYHVRCWGEPRPSQAPLVLVHGWMDVAASFQFVVDALSDAFMQGRLVIAPDWRGYGLTDGAGVDNFWFPDYIADLDFLADHFSPDQPFDLVGHSMGGNVVMQYAGVRPQRVRRLVNLEGFGGPQTTPAQAPGRYAQWLDQLKKQRDGQLSLRSYDNLAGVAQRLAKTNPRLARDQTGRDKAEWLAGHWARQNTQGQWEIMGDAAHKIVNAQLLRVDELLQIYQCITMPVLAVEASDDELWKWWKGSFTREQYHARLQHVPDHRIAVVQDAGHMLHHDQPEPLARLLEEFLGA